MTNVEAKELVERAEKQLNVDYITSARVAGVLAVVCAPFSFCPGISIIAFITSCLLLIYTVGQSLVAYEVQAEHKKNLSQAVWNHLKGFNAFASFLQTSSTKRLYRDIGKLYELDPRGETFPLTQAVRLVDAYARQQSSLEAVGFRLEELQFVKRTMREKLEQLRSLGEDAPDAQHKLAQIERDEAQLSGIHRQIAASCARLEAIWTGVQHAHQVRQLKRELGELSRGTSAEPLQLENEAFDLERQIGREIDTFLALERQTEAHLSDL